MSNDLNFNEKYTEDIIILLKNNVYISLSGVDIFIFFTCAQHEWKI